MTFIQPIIPHSLGQFLDCSLLVLSFCASFMGIERYLKVWPRQSLSDTTIYNVFQACYRLQTIETNSLVQHKHALNM